MQLTNLAHTTDEGAVEGLINFALLGASGEWTVVLKLVTIRWLKGTSLILHIFLYITLDINTVHACMASLKCRLLTLCTPTDRRSTGPEGNSLFAFARAQVRD